MGASKSDYTKVSPPHSFIHVDDFTGQKELAAYLKMLSSSDVLYNKYFDWRINYTITETGNTFCRLCDALHTAGTNPTTKKVYRNFTDFWDLTKHCKDKGRNFGTNIFQRIVIFFFYVFGIY
jgi:hypothetical protein